MLRVPQPAALPFPAKNRVFNGWLRRCPGTAAPSRRRAPSYRSLIRNYGLAPIRLQALRRVHSGESSRENVAKGRPENSGDIGVFTGKRKFNMQSIVFQRLQFLGALVSLAQTWTPTFYGGNNASLELSLRLPLPMLSSENSY